MLDIAFLAHYDYANIMTHWSYYLKKFTNIRSMVIAINQHPYTYLVEHDYNLSQMSTKERKTLLTELLSAQLIILDDTIIWALKKPQYDARNMFRYTIKYLFGVKLDRADIINKSYGIWHPGTIYRNYYNEFNHDGYNIIFTAPDLFGLSPHPSKTLTYYPMPNETEIELTSVIKSKLKNKIILHNPSNNAAKGSDLIKSVVNKVLNSHKEYKFVLLTDLNYDEAMEWKKKSLIYLDQFSSTDGIKGSFGLASFEALLCGNITLSSINMDAATLEQLNQLIPVYKPEHSRSVEFTTDQLPIINIGNYENTFESVLEKLLSCTDSQLEQILTINYHKAICLLNGKTFTLKFLSEINGLTGCKFR